MKKLIRTGFVLLIACSVHAQDSTRLHRFSAEYTLDTYLNIKRAAQPGSLSPELLFNYKRQLVPSLNLFLAKLKWMKGDWEFHAGLMAGDYSRYNLAAEQAFFRHIYELYVHYRINDKFSMEAGILNSHIGLESVPASDNWNAGRSLLAENSPYYETGIRFDFQPDEKWRLTLLLLNGWQHIRDNNRAAALGTQIQYRPSAKILFNLSGFAGNEARTARMPARYFLDLFCTSDLTEKASVAFIADGGSDKDQTGMTRGWWGTAILFRQHFTNWLTMGARAEYFSDPNLIVSAATTLNGFSGTGFSLNTDVQLNRHVMFRMEGRILHAKHPFFMTNRTNRTDRFILAVLGMRF